MARYSRRRALQLGGLGLAGLAVGGAGLTWAAAQRGSPSGVPLLDAPTLAASGGILDVTLDAASGPVPLADRVATALRYNGSIPGPTLRLRAGDILRVALVNRLTEPTNLHAHGLAVSPAGNGDNPFVTVDPGQTFRYEYRIPADHPAGTLWYHPHHHGMVADQVYAGLYGAIVIDDPDPPAVTADRLLVISDITLDAAGAVPPASMMDRIAGRQGDLVLVNGQLHPQLTARPGARERWRVVNACASRYLALRLDGQQVRLLGIDLPAGGPPAAVTDILLAPGNRADLLVTTVPGLAILRADPYDRGSVMIPGVPPDGGEPVDLATLNVTGPTTAPAVPIPAAPPPRDLRRELVTAHRRVILGMSMPMGMASGSAAGFTLDGRTFDPSRVDQTIEAGAIEEWDLVNSSSMDHPFHLHVWPMQLVSVGGEPVQAASWRNVVNVRARTTTTVRISFDRHTGRSVYHCHILDHEDLGMMGVVQVSSSD